MEYTKNEVISAIEKMNHELLIISEKQSRNEVIYPQDIERIKENMIYMKRLLKEMEKKENE